MFTIQAVITDLPICAQHPGMESHMTSRIRFSLLALGIACLPAFAAEEADHERKLEEKDVPKAVLATMTKAAGTAKLSEFEAESKKGKDIYTANFTDVKSNVEMEVTVDPDGKLIGVEKEDEHAGEAAPATPAPDAKK